MAGKGTIQGEGVSLPLEKDFYYLAKTVEKMDKKIERYDETIRSLEKELASVKVWSTLATLLGPGIVIAIILRGLGVK
ncbi:MAG: hypothetical protein NTX88_00140 [Candidatus Atribacteria bacterium]|nr:hypothetical protein [Candidatus Atribacteria bacterium]